MNIRLELSRGGLTPEQALTALVEEARGATLAAARADAWELIGDLAGRAFDASWETAERAAWALIEVARHADSTRERRALLAAMGRGFRNLWLLPYVHGRLADDDVEIAEAALDAAGGLGFAGLEAAAASFLADDAPVRLRQAAVRALGRMGAVSAAPRLATLATGGDPELAAAALTALTEIRSELGVDAAVRALGGSPARELLVAAVRYLGELGRDEVMATLRRMARDADPELRLCAGLAARSYKAERARDGSSEAGERVLAALSERDRAVRALLARRLRSLPVAEVLAQAELFISDDAAGVVQVLGELRTPEITRFLLALAGRAELPVVVRARAVGAVEADEPWEREALTTLALGDGEEMVRVAAAQTMGAFVGVDELFARLGVLGERPEPALRGAFLWALQLAARPGRLSPIELARVQAVLGRALGDEDVAVRRRAAYVCGNLRVAALAGELAALAQREDARADVRTAAYVALEELAAPETAQALSALWRREADPRALVCASRALSAVAAGVRVDLTPLAGKAQHLLAGDDALSREAAARVAGLCGGAVPAAALVPLAAAGQGAPRVREEAIAALGRLLAAGAAEAGGEVAVVLEAGLADADAAVQEQAAWALAAAGGRRALERLVAWAAGDGEPAARARLAAKLQVPPSERAHFRPLVDEAVARLHADDPAWEPLIELKIALLDVAGAPGAGVDEAIVGAFPAFAQLAKVSGFDPLARSLRTAEALYRGAASGPADADLSPPIVLWMKCLEGYVHAWLSRRLATLQKEPLVLFEHVERLLGPVWPTYQRFVGERWPDLVDMGGFRVEVPVRALPNALKELGERRPKRLDSPLSVTEWARLMVFFAVDHPSGVKNLFKLTITNADHTVRVAHRLASLAGARNLATHRAAAGPQVLEAFRKGYYAVFEDLTRMA